MDTSPDGDDDLDHSMTIADNAEPAAEALSEPTSEPVFAQTENADAQPRKDTPPSAQPRAARAAPVFLQPTATPPPPITGDGPGEPANEAIFSQQLWEVQLLIDFLSGNPRHRLPDRASTDAAGLPKDWIEQVCEMTWPASGSAHCKADQEALLVKVKDYLNALAAPANGFSVAFTLLVTQEDDPASGGPPRPQPSATAGNTEPRQSGMTESRKSLARKAYPDLAYKSRSFRGGIRLISFMLTGWLAITCLFSWYLALGNSALGQLATAQVAMTEAQARTISTQGAQATAQVTAPATSPSDSAAVAPQNTRVVQLSSPAISARPLATLALSGMAYCDQAMPAAADVAVAPPVYGFAAQSEVCANFSAAKANLAAARSNVMGWLWHRPTGDQDDERKVLYATAMINMLGSAVLPICYGILGAAAAVLRLLSKRMRLSLLTPRDLTLSLQQLALGAVIGACIGLFVADPAVPGRDGATLLGPVQLSGSALSFIAGFGVDAVFSALEAMIARLFNTSPAATSAK